MLLAFLVKWSGLESCLGPSVAGHVRSPQFSDFLVFQCYSKGACGYECDFWSKTTEAESKLHLFLVCDLRQASVPGQPGHLWEKSEGRKQIP